MCAPHTQRVFLMYHKWLITWKLWNVITYLSKIGWNLIFLFIPDHMWATWNKHKCLYNAWMFLPLPCNYVYPLHTSCARVCLMSSLMDGRIPLLSYQINQMVNIIPNNLNLLYILKEYLPFTPLHFTDITLSKWKIR